MTLATGFRAAVTVLLLFLVGWWLAVVVNVIDQPVAQDANGNVLDQYQRAKDILLVVLPLLTLALGYWFGAEGKERAEKNADKAKEKAEKKQTELTQAVVERAAGQQESSQERERGRRLARHIKERGPAPESYKRDVAPPDTQPEITAMARALYPEVFEESTGG